MNFCIFVTIHLESIMKMLFLINDDFNVLQARLHRLRKATRKNAKQKFLQQQEGTLAETVQEALTKLEEKNKVSAFIVKLVCVLLLL